jgi:membrane protein YqaA with SNARE-associated domain
VKRPQLSPKQQAFLRIILAIVLTGLAMAALWLLRESGVLQNLGYVGVFIVGLLANATIFLPAPSWALTIAAGAALNPLPVALAAAMGEALGEITGYLAGSSGSIVLENREGYQKSARLMKRWGVWFIMFLAFIPNPAFDFVGILAGALRMPVPKFLWGAFLGKFLRALLLAYGGYGIFNHFLGG